MIALLVVHAVVGLVLFAVGDRFGRFALAVAAIPSAAAVAVLGLALPTVLDGGARHEAVSWVPALGITLALRLDGYAALMLGLVSVVGVLVGVYGASYFRTHGDDEPEPGLGRLAGLLVLFSGAMTGVVLADDLITLFTAWELTSVTSYLLIGNRHERPEARAAALHALLVTAAGGLAMMAGIVLLGAAAGTYRIGELVAAAPRGTAVTVGAVLVLVGAFTKSAQYPFHSWLPGAMVAPTPVSAYLHSATMVKAGVFLVGRLAPAFATVPGWRPLVVVVGLTSMVAGGLRALRQHDLKLLLAFGTISQLGLLTVLLGLGVPAATTAGCVLLVAHGAFKAALFMVVGIVDHQTGTRDLRRLPPLGRGWRATIAVGVVSAASMAGVPLAFGFVAKEKAYQALLDAPVQGAGPVLAIMVAGSALTFAYSARVVWGLAWLPRRRAGLEVPHPPARAFVAPGVLLAVVTLVLGVWPGLLDRPVDAAARSLATAPKAVHLALWHGFNTALALSAVTVTLGLALFAARRAVGRVLSLGGRVPTGTDAYAALLAGLNRLAAAVTATVQNGSLPFYAGVILATAAIVPGVTLLSSGVERPGLPPWATSAAEVPVVALLVGAALAAAVVRRRFAAALFLGVVGYAMAGVFVVHGAPDLALTQAAIETLSTVVFVLVLRRLPDRFERRSTRGFRAVRVVVSVAVGAVVFALALVAGDARRSPGVSGEIIDRSVPDGHGQNVVNVILVDVRGLDTLAEISVLAAAAIGAVALARVDRRGGRRNRTPETTT